MNSEIRQELLRVLSELGELAPMCDSASYWQICPTWLRSSRRRPSGTWRTRLCWKPPKLTSRSCRAPCVCSLTAGDSWFVHEVAPLLTIYR